MPRPKGGDRILGPYREEAHGAERWRLIVHLGGKVLRPVFDKEAEAAAYKADMQSHMQLAQDLTIGAAAEKWEQELKDRGLLEATIYKALYSVREFFAGELGRPLRWLLQDPRRGEQLYQGLRTRPSKVRLGGGAGTGPLLAAIAEAGEAGYLVPACPRGRGRSREKQVLRHLRREGTIRVLSTDESGARYVLAGPQPAERPLKAATHRRVLRDARRFCAFCVEQGWLAANPLEKVKAVGRQGRRKRQLGLDEARRFYAVALGLARTGTEGATAVLTALLLGLRQSEVTRRAVRDLDDRGRRLRIDEGKTASSKGTMEVPADLQPLLLRQVQGKLPLAPLFGSEGKPHADNWLRYWTREICRRAKVGLDEHGRPLITAHSLRGMFGSIGVTTGQMPHLVAQALRHTEEVSRAHYIEPAAVAAAQQGRLVELLTKEGPDALA